MERKFQKGFVKTAKGLPKWLHDAVKTMDSGRRSFPAYSKRGVEGMWKRRKMK